MQDSTQVSLFIQLREPAQQLPVRYWPNESPAPVPGTLFRQGWTSLPLRRPILTWVSIFNHIKHVLKVHVRNACEPMHQTLHMWLAADVIAQGVEQGVEELFHLLWTAEAGDGLEALCIGPVRSIGDRSLSGWSVSDRSRSGWSLGG